MNPELQGIFNDTLRDRLYSDTAEGSALPNAAYTSEACHRLEQTTVFRRNWVFATFAHRIPRPGDMVPAEVGGLPLILLRDDAGEIRCFHNVCSHRGAKLLVEKKMGRKTLVCPNHSWSYSLGGQLLARPHFFGGDRHDHVAQGVSRACHRADLKPVRCETWQDWVFVNIDGSALNFASWIEPVSNALEGYDLGELGFAEALTFDIGANWKLAIENFIEPYHVFSCHPWLNGFVPMAERTAPVFEDHVLRCGYEFRHTDPARGEGLPYFPDLSETQKRRGDWFVLFPNFAFEVFPDQVDVFVATPTGIRGCHETIALYFVGDGATGESYADARKKVTDNWRELNREDIGVIERMQAGRESEAFDGGVLSPYWDPVLQHFGRLVFDQLTET